MATNEPIRSMRTLFGRGETGSISTEREVISIATNLENHVGGRSTSLRKASQEFVEYVDGDGFARGCRELDGPELNKTIPSWVSVDDPETRTLEGVLEKSKLTYTDFPLSPWHDYYDWNFDVTLDPQYEYLLSGREDYLHCEWDTEHLPKWVWPQEGDRVKMVGRWIYDCGHPEGGNHKTELHPVKAIMAIRPDAYDIDGTGTSQRMNEAWVYIGREGGYWTHDINDQDYSFELPLPPKPDNEAEPTWYVEHQTTPLAVEPEVTPFPSGNPTSLHVDIPLEGVTPHPDEYGIVVYGGWTDPRGIEAQEIHQVDVTLEKLDLESNQDYGPDNWHLYAAINGRWDRWEEFGGGEKQLGKTLHVDVHSDDQICISACGFDADAMHNYMGNPLVSPTGNFYDWDDIRSANDGEASVIRMRILAQLAGTLNNRNEEIAYKAKTIDPGFRGHGTMKTDDYTLHYRVEDR